MARSPKNTTTGLRWVCADCADADKRKVVATIQAKYAGTCKLGGEPLSPGQTVFALDSGVRKLRKGPPPQPALIPMPLGEAIVEMEMWMSGKGQLSPGAAMRVLDAARTQLEPS